LKETDIARRLAQDLNKPDHAIRPKQASVLVRRAPRPSLRASSMTNLRLPDTMEEMLSYYS